MINSISQKHILVAPSWFRSKVNLNSGNFFLEQAQALSKAGFKVGIISNTTVSRKNFKYLNILDYFVTTREEINGVEIFKRYSPVFPGGAWPVFGSFVKKLNAFFENLSWQIVAKDYVRAVGKPNLLHVHSFLLGPSLKGIGKTLNVDYIITEHWSGFFQPEVRKNFLPVMTDVYLSAKRVFAVSLSLANEMKACTGLTSSVLYNSFSFDAPLPDFVKFSEFTFISIGNLIPIKQFDLLIEAFAMAFLGKPIKLVIVGSGPLLDPLNALIQKVNLVGQVQIKAAMPKSALLNLMQQCHGLVSASEFETFGMTLIEAFSLGIPVIGINTGSRPEIIFDENLGLLSSNNKEDLAHTLELFYKNYKSWSANTIFSLAKAKFSDEVLVSQLTKIYDSMD